MISFVFLSGAKRRKRWFSAKELLTPLLIAAKLVQRVTEYKLLGVTTVNATMKWDDHSNAITSKAAKRLGFLKKLKRAGVHKQDLLYFFLTVIWPVLEYACPAWHTSLTKQQTTSLENIHRRALQIIAGNIPYDEAYVVCSNWLRCLRDEIVYVVNCLGS